MIRQELLQYITDRNLDLHRTYLPDLVHRYAIDHNIKNTDFEWLLWNWLPPQLRENRDVAKPFNDLKYTTRIVVEKWLRRGTPPMTIEECIEHSQRFYCLTENDIEYFSEPTWIKMT